MKTVAYDSDIFAQQQFGGVSRYFCELANRLSSSHPFTPRIIAPVYVNQYLRHARVAVHGVHIAATSRRGLRRLPDAINAVLSPIFFYALAPDIVHETYFRIGRRHRDVPTVTTVYDMIHERFSSMFSRADTTSRRKRASVERADLVICISEQTRRDLIEIFKVPLCKTRVVYLAASPATLSDEPLSASGQASERPYLLYVGSRGGYKNFSTLLEAYATLSDLRRNLRIVAFGGGAFSGEERAQIELLGLSEADVQQRSGGDRALVSLYRNAVALIHPSFYEGFGIPPLEAMALRCPVICSPGGSLSEVVGDAAHLFDPSNYEELSEKIRDVVEHSDLRSHLIERGSRRAELFSWDRCASETADVYRELAT